MIVPLLIKVTGGAKIVFYFREGGQPAFNRHSYYMSTFWTHGVLHKPVSKNSNRVAAEAAVER